MNRRSFMKSLGIGFIASQVPVPSCVDCGCHRPLYKGICMKCSSDRNWMAMAKELCDARDKYFFGDLAQSLQ